MNILPKKSWHVRTKKNIERVRRDEAEAAAKEKELSKRAHIANFEASLDILRKRNGTGGHDGAEDESRAERAANGVGPSVPPATGDSHVSGCVEENSSSLNNDDQTLPLPGGKSSDIVNPSGSSSGTGHLNLFRDVELAEGKLHGGNLEAEADRRREQEEWEKKVGILQYLGQSSNNAEAGSERFYQRLDRTVGGGGESGSTAHSTSTSKAVDAVAAALAAARKRDQREKDAQDPLRTIHKYLWQKKPDLSSPSSPRASSPCASTAAGAAGSSGSNSIPFDPRQRQQQADLRRIEFLPEGVSNVKRKVSSSTSGDKRRRPSISSSSTDDEHTRRQRKRAKAKKSKRRRTPSSESDPESEEERRDRKRSNLDLLRRQRLEREERERRRTSEYLEGLVGKANDGQDGGGGGGSSGGAGGANESAAGGDTDRNRRYNSQYNPHLARY